MKALETRALPLRIVAWFLAILPSAIWWIERLVAMPRSGWFAGETTFAIGGDFRTFHTAASLAVQGDGAILYDPSVFRAALGPEVASYGPLGNPPPLVALLAPLGWLSFEVAWLVFAALSLAGIALSLRLLGIRRWVLATLATLLFPPVYYTVTFGQLGALWLLIIAGTYVLLKGERLVLAGSLGGLLVMKPTLAFGLALWWLVEWRKYRVAAVAAVGSALGALGVSYLLLPEVWTSYGDSLGAFVELRETVTTQWAQVSAWAFWDLLLPDSRTLATFLGVGSSMLIGAGAIALLRRSATLEHKASIAILVTLLAMPHLLAYDWTLLLIPGVLLWGTSPRLGLVFAGVTAASAWSIMLTNVMLDRGGFAVQIAPLALLGAAWFLFHPRPNPQPAGLG